MTATLLRTTTAIAAGLALLSGAAMAQDDRSDWPESITVGTASQGGTYFIYGNGWANLIGEELGINAGGEVTGGPVQNATLVQSGDAEFGMVTMGPAYEAWTGASPLMPGLAHDKLRAIFPMYQTGFQVITLESSGIDTVDGLDGLTVGVGPAGGTPGTYWPRIFDTLGISIDVQNGGAADLAGQLQDGLIDGFAFAAGIPISAFSQVEAQVDVNIFGPTDEQIATLLETYPSLADFVIPGGTYPSEPEDIHTVAMWNFAVASADMPESLVYEIVSIIMGNNERMMQIHGAARETLPENYVHNTFLPWHPGAVRWFEENGFDIPDDLEG